MDVLRAEFEEAVSRRSKHAYLLLDIVDQEWVCRANISADRIGQYVDEDIEAEWQEWKKVCGS